MRAPGAASAHDSPIHLSSKARMKDQLSGGGKKNIYDKVDFKPVTHWKPSQQPPEFEQLTLFSKLEFCVLQFQP